MEQFQVASAVPVTTASGDQQVTIVPSNLQFANSAAGAQPQVSCFLGQRRGTSIIFLPRNRSFRLVSLVSSWFKVKPSKYKVKLFNRYFIPTSALHGLKSFFILFYTLFEIYFAVNIIFACLSMLARHKSNLIFRMPVSFDCLFTVALLVV